LALTVDGKALLLKYCYCLLHLSKIPALPHDQIRAIRGFYANIKNSLLELPLCKVFLARLFTERVGKIFTWLDQWRLIPDGSNFVREQLDEDSGAVLVPLTSCFNARICALNRCSGSRNFSLLL
jgi:hypothetical protein